jgi:Spy/CpxP family protein refolding chaperone
MFRARLVAALLILGLVGFAASQEKDKDKKKSEDKPTKLKGFLPPNFKKLGLTDKQVQEIYKVQAEYKDRIDDLKAKMKKLQEAQKEAIEKVLTPEQRQRLKEIRTGEKGEK